MTAISTRALLNRDIDYFDEGLNSLAWRIRMKDFIGCGLPINTLAHLTPESWEREIALLAQIVNKEINYENIPLPLLNRRPGETWPIVAWWDFQGWAFNE